MSVKVRLNNKGFLAGNSMVIGGRLFEGEVQNQQPAQQQQQPAQQQQAQAQPAQQPQQQQQAPAQQPQQQQQPAQQQNQNASGQTQSVDQQIQAVLVKHFGGLQQTIANDLKAIQGPQWVNVVAPKDQSLNSVMGALQEYIKQNIEVAKKFVESSNQQQNASTNQNASANA